MKRRLLSPSFAVAAAAAGCIQSTAVAQAATGTVSKYVFNPRPIAPIGSLAADTSVAVTLTLEDSNADPVPGGGVFLSFTPTTGGGTASVGDTALTTTPEPFNADAEGRVAITYRTPATLPAGGTDVIKAQNKPVSANFNKSDIYRYRAPVLRRYVWDPYPIATPGSLTSGERVSLTVTATTSGGTGVPGATIYLSRHGGRRLGTASVGITLLTKSPHPFTANSAGQVTVVFTASTVTPLPTTGTITLIAQNAASSPPVSGADSYSYGVPAAYVFSPRPIASTGTLAAGSSVTVTLIVRDSAGHIVAGARVELLFQQTTGGGSATAGHTALGSTPVGVVTDRKGRIVITYHVATSPPPSGTDTIVAENTAKSPTLTASDSYTY